MKLSDDGSSYADGAWVNKDVQVAIAAEDVGPAGLTELVIQVNDESPVMLVDDFAHNLVLADNGIYEISVRATDRAGNPSTLKRTVKISKPVASNSSNPGSGSSSGPGS